MRGRRRAACRPFGAASRLRACASGGRTGSIDRRAHFPGQPSLWCAGATSAVEKAASAATATTPAGHGISRRFLDRSELDNEPHLSVLLNSVLGNFNFTTLYLVSPDCQKILEGKKSVSTLFIVFLRRFRWCEPISVACQPRKLDRLGARLTLALFHLYEPHACLFGN